MTKRHPTLERFTARATFKATKTDGKTFLEGFGNVYAVDGEPFLDVQSDIVHRGAFAKSIEERIPAGLVKLMDGHGWDMGAVLGTIVEADERTVDGVEGLWIRAELSDAESVRDRVVKLEEGHVNRLSVGFDVVSATWEEREDGTWVRHVREAKLYEVSAVPFAANEASVVTHVGKSPFADLPPVLGDYTWDAEAALERVAAWSAAKAPLQQHQVRRAFACYAGGNPCDAKSYGLQLADVVGGKLRVVPEAVIKAAAMLAGAKASLLTITFEGGGEVTGDELASARAHVAGYLKSMGLVPPWDAEGAIEIRSAHVAVGVHDQAHREAVVDAVGRLDAGTKAAITEALQAAPPTQAGTDDAEATKRSDLTTLELDDAELAADLDLHAGG